MRRLSPGLALVLVALAMGAPQAQDYPTRPIRIVVPFVAGGAVDTLARLVGARLGDALGQPVIVENRAGAGGNLGADAVAKSSPDGYTILLTTNGHAIAPALYRKLPFDPVQDFAPVTQVVASSLVLVASPQSQLRSAQDLIEVRVARPTIDGVQPIFEAAFRAYGLPGSIRCDNAAPFGSAGAGGLTRLSAWWVKLGIEPRFIRPGSPQDNGRHERMHRTLQEQTARSPAANARAQQARFDAFRRHYNEERPHEALGQRMPGELYTPRRERCRNGRSPGMTKTTRFAGSTATARSNGGASASSSARLWRVNSLAWPSWKLVTISCAFAISRSV